MTDIIEKLKINIKKSDDGFYCNGSNEINNEYLKLFYINEEEKANYINLPNEIPQKINLLINSSKIAKFGLGNKTVEDAKYRYAYQLNPNLFSLDNSFDIYNFGIINKIHKILKYDVDINDIYLDLYCLNIYTKNGFFKSHIDTPKSEKMFGSLVISLPSNYKGGILKVKHKNICKNFDLSTDNKKEIKWVAFYSDCEHEITEILDGYRITLTYNLYIKEKELQYKNINFENVELYNILKEIKKYNYSNFKIGYFMEHKYPNLIKINNEKTDFMKILKGSDLKLFLICKKLGLNIQFKGVIDVEINEYNYDDFKEIFYNDYYSDSESENSCESIPDNILLITDDLTINNGSQYIEEDKELFQVLENSGAEYDKDIVWINKPINWIKSSAYVAYGNEAETNYHYVTCSFIVNINS